MAFPRHAGLDPTPAFFFGKQQSWIKPGKAKEKP
jgi:hypothetical protein